MSTLKEMTSNQQEIRTAILTSLKRMEASDFVTEFLFDRVPYIFGNDRSAFSAWKGKLATHLEVDPACVVLVGSAAIGLSLNPSKGFRSFDERSDIDAAIISNFHFTMAWRYLRSNGHRRTHVDTATRIAWDEHVKRFIYWGTIATDRLLGILPFGNQWLFAVGQMARISPTAGRDINLRIYADFESLRTYQHRSADRAREELLTQGETDATLS